MHKYKTVAEVHKVSVSTIGALVKQFEADPEFLENLKRKHDEELEAEDRVHDVVEELLAENNCIDKIKDVRMQIAGLPKYFRTRYFITEVLKEHNLSYRKKRTHVAD